MSPHSLRNSTKKPRNARVWGPPCSQLWPAQCLHPQSPWHWSVSGSPWAFSFPPACWTPDMVQLGAPASSLPRVFAGKAQRLRPLYQYINYCNPELNETGEGDSLLMRSGHQSDISRVKYACSHTLIPWPPRMPLPNPLLLQSG